MKFKRLLRALRNSVLIGVIFAVLATASESFAKKDQQEVAAGKVISITINGTINPATDDFLKRSIEVAKERNATLLLIKLNTPGGLLTSMQTMVEAILGSPVPVAVYVSPQGGSATSAGVFVTMAAHFAAMAPGTTIGAAHPVQGGGQDVGEDMKAKVENFTVSLIKAVAEQRGRNIEWAEKSVRESVSITDREAVKKNVVDFVATDVADFFRQIEGKKTKADNKESVLTGLINAEVEELAMTFRQMVVNILSDPNIAILIGLAAMLGLGIEFYNPGLIFPGVFGAICLILSLTAGQILPINYGGVALLILAVVFIGIEFTMPAFGIWGIAGIVCLILGSIYVVDTELVWSAEGFSVDMALVSTVAAGIGLLFLVMGMIVSNDRHRKVKTGKEGLIGEIAKVREDFKSQPGAGYSQGRVFAMGEIWKARCVSAEDQPKKGEELKIVAVEDGLRLVVER